MRKRNEWPVALTIAGSDSGGGAGIQADLKTFAALHVHGTSVLTCVTAQNPNEVAAIEPCSLKMIGAQLETVAAAFPPRAAKTGMLLSAAAIGLVARWLERRPCPLVVDPVMVATSGARLLRSGALRTLTHRLLPLATLVTPNVPEAEALLELRIREPEDLRRAARQLHERWGCAALVKGGHLRTPRESVDVFFDGASECLLSARRITGVKTHGTGCTYSAAIAAHLARGETLEKAVRLGKELVTQSIANHYRARGHAILNFAARKG